MTTETGSSIYFSDVFGVTPETLEQYGAFDISLINDLPLFIDPFLLFNSEKAEYQALHELIIRYVRFLRDKAVAGAMTEGLLRAWFMFPEVRQTWLGYSRVGNGGSGLGREFAEATIQNLGEVFRDFGQEQITKGSHIEKLCLFANGVGRDNISDFTTNLITAYLAEYTQTFAREHLAPSLRREVPVPKAAFNYATETWKTARYELPFVANDYVLLTPVDLLTKDDIWINRTDLVRGYHHIVTSIEDVQLREQINNYFAKVLPEDYGQKEEDQAAVRAILRFPELIEHYIRYKEDNGDEAEAISDRKVEASKQMYIEHVRELIGILGGTTPFYETTGSTLAETRARVAFLKDVIENKDGFRYFVNANGKPIRREEDLQLMFRLTWFNTVLDVNREVNNGRGPVDFTVSRGKRGKTLVEFKLASNTSLRRNLKTQAEIYQKASDAEHALKVILFFSEAERERVRDILKELGLVGHPNVVLIDARPDNKPSASKATTAELD